MLRVGPVGLDRPLLQAFETHRHRRGLVLCATSPALGDLRLNQSLVRERLSREVYGFSGDQGMC